MNQEFISLAHGNGGRWMRELIREVFAAHLNNPTLDTDLDAACLPQLEGPLKMSTDGFSVQPLFFPGGDIGSLAIHGTCNDLAVSGAVPRYLTLNAFIEEGFAISNLRKLVISMADAAHEASVEIVAGDTKILPKGHGGGVYFATTGIGTAIPSMQLDMHKIRPRDKILVSGTLGDHGIAILLARQEFGLSADLQSDSTLVLPLVTALSDLAGVRFLRDPTRGGLNSVLHEIRNATTLGSSIDEAHLPFNESVRSVCEILGYDPLMLASEGRVVAVVAEESAEKVLARWRNTPNGENAAIIGRIEEMNAPVTIKTRLGGGRLLHELEGDPLPRIC